MKKLIIVESPNKVEKIKSFLKDLNDTYEVTSSVGHIRELSKSGKYLLGIDLDNMIPKYKISTEKKKVINEINKLAKKADEILLATDPDREGESIAWHIKEILKDVENKKIKRIIFNEISKDAILKSLDNPIDLDNDLIYSQESRRMLDRMIGFRLSNLTKKKISAQSSGRVKSSTLKMIIDRENEIKKFIPEKWFTLEALLKDDFKLIYVDEKFIEIKSKDKEKLEKVKSDLNELFKLKTKKESIKTIKPPVPLEMSDLLMKGYTKLGFSNSQVTFLSQSLYEKGYITYPRTDSKRISSVNFLKEVSEYIQKNTKSNFNELKTTNKKSQDAHEAIRPVSIVLKSNKLSELNKNEKKLYDLIWKQTIQSFMDPAKQKTTKYIYENNGYLFSISLSEIIEEGFKYYDDKDETKTLKLDEKEIIIKNNQINIVDHTTKPPSRYNQASLIKKMKEEGVGRPSTYSSTTNGLIKFNYILNENKSLIPTEMGIEVIELLNKNFSDIIDEKYTSLLEQKLDLISEGKLNSKQFLKDFWEEFSPRVDFANETIEVKMPEFVGRKCPEDDGELVYKISKYKEKFIACLNFPKCRYTEKLVKKEIEYTGENCPDCSSPLVYRYARRNNEKFIGCSAFPKCKYVAKIQKKDTQKD